MRVLITARRLMVAGSDYHRGQLAELDNKTAARMIERGHAVADGQDPKTAAEKRRPKTPAGPPAGDKPTGGRSPKVTRPTRPADA